MNILRRLLSKRISKIILVVICLGTILFLLGNRFSGTGGMDIILSRFFDGQNEAIPEDTGAEEIYAISHNDEIPAVEPLNTNTISENKLPASTDQEASSQQPQQEPVTKEIIHLKDLYVEGEAEVILKSYFPDATSYVWERYDLQSREWEVMDGQTGLDELFREISLCYVECTGTRSPVMIRCTITTPEQVYEEVCTINPLDKKIVEISTERFEANAGQYLSAADIPVNVNYEDGSEETITGLYGVYWLTETEDSEFSQSLSGNQTQIITRVITEGEYQYIEPGEHKANLHYRIAEDKKAFEALIDGKDLVAPDIISLQLGDYLVSNTDKPITIPVTVTAADNLTLYTDLEYCFLPPGTKPTEEDWKTGNTWSVEADKNGIWVLYVRDAAGNISTEEREILVIDELPPSLQVKLENSDWCSSTNILVTSTDKHDVLYSFTCKDTGESSGWTTQAQWPVDNNGIWVIEAKDSLENLATKEITISNIDKESPVIHGITITTTTQGGKENE